MECNCGGGGTTTGSNFLQGHDENVRSAVMYLLGNTMSPCRILRFGPGARNAQELCAEARRNTVRG